MKNFNQENTCIAPKHWTRQAAEEATNHQISHIQAEVEVLRQEDDVKSLVVGAVVPTTDLKDLLPQDVNLSKNIVVIFLPEELGPHILEMAMQSYGLAPAWDIKKMWCTNYHTWNIPDFQLTDPRFDPELKSQLWIPDPCLYIAYGNVFEDSPPELLSLVFVTPKDVYIASQLVDYEHLVNLQVIDASMDSSKPMYWFTQRQLRLAEEEAEKVGRWPWMDGVWPLYGEYPEKSVNVVGGLLFDLADERQPARKRLQARSATPELR